MTVKIVVTVQNLDNILRRMNHDYLLGAPWRKAMTHATLAALSAAQERSPVDTGRLRSSITNRIDASSVPLWGEVGTNVFYGETLEFGARYHYRAGPRRGAPTRGWFSGALDTAAGAIANALRDAARAIEAAWKG